MYDDLNTAVPSRRFLRNALNILDVVLFNKTHKSKCDIKIELKVGSIGELLPFCIPLLLKI